MLYFLALIVTFTIALLIYYIRTDNKELGESEESERQMKEFLDECKKAKAATDALNSDPDFRRELQDKYSRDK